MQSLQWNRDAIGGLMLGPFILFIWTTYAGVKVPTSAEFISQEACQNALATLKEKGFKDGVCLSKQMGK